MDATLQRHSFAMTSSHDDVIRHQWASSRRGMRRGQFAPRYTSFGSECGRSCRPIAAAVKTAVRGQGLASAHSGRHRHAIGMAVENHHRVTGPRSIAVDLESRVAAAPVSVRVRPAHERAREGGIHRRATVTPHVPAPVGAPSSGSAIVSAAERIAGALLVGAERGAEIGRAESGRASSTRVRRRAVISVDVRIVAVEGDAVPLSVVGDVVEALAGVEGAHHGARRRGARPNVHLTALARRSARARAGRRLGYQGRDEHDEG